MPWACLRDVLLDDSLTVQVSIEECAKELQKQNLIKKDVCEALWHMIASRGDECMFLIRGGMTF